MNYNNDSMLGTIFHASDSSLLYRYFGNECKLGGDGEILTISANFKVIVPL